MTNFNIRPIDIEEYLRGQDDRAKGYPITAHGDDAIDQDGQATDAYCAGYDPEARIVAYQQGQERAGEAFRKQLRKAVQKHQAPQIRRIDTLEFLRGKLDRAAQRPMSPHGDKNLEDDPQVADAYCAGYDPTGELLHIKAGHKELLAALQEASIDYAQELLEQLQEAATEQRRARAQREHKQTNTDTRQHDE